MKYILFVMMLTAPSGPPDKQAWVLVSSTSMAFETQQACQKAGDTIQESTNKSTMVRTIGWCFAGGSQVPGSPINALPFSGMIPLDKLQR